MDGKVSGWMGSGIPGKARENVLPARASKSLAMAVVDGYVRVLRRNTTARCVWKGNINTNIQSMVIHATAASKRRGPGCPARSEGERGRRHHALDLLGYIVSSSL
mmetsp:Transcript_1347/g.3868  ORF Transcript_1347/g.3868 Transcript_1347/m.3868 type:complete len:105 (-) Transcript_1347:688-1002(-)